MRANLFPVVVAVGISIWSLSALAYRPFDGTDAAVADNGEIEIELSPVSFQRSDAGVTWIAPSFVANFGLSENWEAVLEGEATHASGLSHVGGIAASLKGVLRPGSLQGQAGLSWATEVSLLLPGIRTDDGAGFEWAGLASQQMSWGAYHINFGGGLSRDGNGLAFAGLILEGPEEWPVRPVAEFRYEREFEADDETSILLGLIWNVGDTYDIDLAVRHASVSGRPENQIRAGLSFALPF